MPISRAAASSRWTAPPARTRNGGGCPGAAVPELPASRIEEAAEEGDEAIRPFDLAETAVHPFENLVRLRLAARFGAEEGLDVRHQDRCGNPLARHVPDGQANAPRPGRNVVEVVAADLLAGQSGRRELDPGHLGRGVREKLPLQGLRDQQAPAPSPPSCATPAGTGRSPSQGRSAWRGSRESRDRFRRRNRRRAVLPNTAMPKWRQPVVIGTTTRASSRVRVAISSGGQIAVRDLRLDLLAQERLSPAEDRVAEGGSKAHRLLIPLWNPPAEGWRRRRIRSREVGAPLDAEARGRRSEGSPGRSRPRSRGGGDCGRTPAAAAARRTAPDRPNDRPGPAGARGLG